MKPLFDSSSDKDSGTNGPRSTANNSAKTPASSSLVTATTASEGGVSTAVNERRSARMPINKLISGGGNSTVAAVAVSATATPLVSSPSKRKMTEPVHISNTPSFTKNSALSVSTVVETSALDTNKKVILDSGGAKWKQQRGGTGVGVSADTVAAAAAVFAASDNSMIGGRATTVEVINDVVAEATTPSSLKQTTLTPTPTAVAGTSGSTNNEMEKSTPPEKRMSTRSSSSGGAY